MKTAEDYLIEATAITASYISDQLQEDIIQAMQEYATEALKADREMVAEKAKVKKVATPVGNYHEVDKQSILNLPIELK